MAGELFKALMESQYGATDSPYGIGAASIASAAPLLYNPYASTGSNIGYTVGAGLLSGLLGGLAKRQAAEENATLFKTANLFRTASPEEREGIIKENPRLANYGLMYQEQEEAAKQAALQEQMKREQDLYYEIEKQKRLLPIEQQKAVGGKLAEVLADNNMLPIGKDGAPVDLSALGLKSKGELDAFNVGLKRSAELRAEADSLGYNPKKLADETSLRKEVNALPEVQNFLNVEKSAKIIDQAIRDPSAVSDQELVRYSILLMEPGMAVREGEQAAIANSQSLPEAWKNSMMKAWTGEAQLGSDVREGMKRLAMRAYQGHKDQYDRAMNFYAQRAKEANINPENLSRIGESSLARNIFESQGAIETKILRDGSRVKVQRQADGSYLEVE
jgi:hypothetical protein